MKKIKITILLATLGLASVATAQTYGNHNSYQNEDWTQVYNQTVSEIKNQQKQQDKNYVFEMNERVNKIESSKRTKFTINAPRVVDVYVRESYTVLEKNYIVKNAPIWKKVMIKQEEIWDY